MRTALFPIFAVLLFSGRLYAQTGSQVASQLEAELDRLSETADTLQSRLPSFACTEVVSSKDLKSSGELKYRTDFVADLRVLPQPNGKVTEQYTITTWNGRPFTGQFSYLPIYMEGGFRMASNYFQSKYRGCFHYNLEPGRLDFQALPAPDLPPGCRDVEGVAGFALLDAEGNMTHVERRIPPNISMRDNRAPYAALDLAPVDLGGQVFRLGSHIVGEGFAKDGRTRFEAFYTGCHLFHTTVTILPDSHVVQDSHP